jgi:hypothetical protein
MSGTRKPVQSPRSKRRKAALEPKHHTCIECPACGTESCKILQQLGMYCDTAVATTEAWRAEPPEKRKSSVA